MDRADASGLVIVKLGGAHALSPDLADELDALAGWRRPMVLVPGGGPFADAVRQAQPVMEFDDRAAHHMALLAMEQFGLAICSLDDRYVPASRTDGFAQALSAGQIPVWLPSQMALADPSIEMSWRVTSDSLAVWLAGQLGACDVVLVKRIAEPVAQSDIGVLVGTGVVDEALPEMLQRYPVCLSIIGPLGQGIAAA